MGGSWIAWTPFEGVLAMSEANPYASPTAAPDFAIDQEVSASELQVATQGKRFLNMIIDGITIQLLSFVAGYMLGYAYVALTGPIRTSESEAQLQLMGFVLGLMVSLGYFVLMEWLFQRTVAKFITNTVVVREDGMKPTFSQILGRSLTRFVPLEAFTFLGSRNPVGWHDRWSGTRVVVGR
jgi:uncharacterized RDD family membrane protein YckC